MTAATPGTRTLRATPRTSSSGREVYVKNLRDDEAVSSPFALSLGVLGADLGVAPAGTEHQGHRALPSQLHARRAAGNVVRQVPCQTDAPRPSSTCRSASTRPVVTLHDGAGNQLLKGTPVRFNVNRHDR